MTNLAEEFGWSLRARGYSDWTIHDHTTAARRFIEALQVPIEDASRSHAERYLATISSPFQRRKATFGIKAFSGWLCEENISEDFGGAPAYAEGAHTSDGGSHPRGHRHAACLLRRALVQRLSGRRPSRRAGLDRLPPQRDRADDA